MKILDSIFNRRSVMAFRPEIVDAEHIRLLFEAASLAPSAHNEQPWRFFYARRENHRAFDELIGLLTPDNAEWAKNASVIVFSVAETIFARNGKRNYHALHDTGLATSNLMIQAESMGMVSHPMSGLNPVAAHSYLKLTDSQEVVAAIAIGFKGNVEGLSESNRTRELSARNRKPLKEVAFEL